VKARNASAPRPVYRAKAQPADEGGHAVLRGGVTIFGDLHASLASAVAHDLNAALGSGRVYRCGPLSAGQECKGLASDRAKVAAPRGYVGDAAEFVAELNRAAKPRANPSRRRAGVADARKNPSWRKRAPAGVGAPRVYWRWINAGGYAEKEFFLPASIRTEAQMREHRDLLLRKIEVASDMIAPRSATLRKSLRSAGRYVSMRRPSFGLVEILPRVRRVGYGVDEVIEWDVLDDGEKLGSFHFVRQDRRPIPSKRRAAAK